MESQKMINTSTYTSQTCWSQQQTGVYQHVTVGMVTEVCPEEQRVILTPNIAREFILNGHKVCVQSGAGKRAGFTDEMYKHAGATIVNTAEEVYKHSTMIVKVQQPQDQEIAFVQPKQTIFSFMDFNSQSCQTMLKAAAQRGAVMIGYQYIQNSGHAFPVFNTLSELTGYLGMQQVMKYYESQGKVLGQLGGMTGSQVLILGATPCGIRAAQFAAGIGARVTIMDSSVDTLRRASELMPSSVSTLKYTAQNLEQTLPTVDVLVGAVMTPTTKAPVLVNEAQLKLLRPGAFAIDLATSMGGNFSNTTPKNPQTPTTTANGVTFYTSKCVTSVAPNTFATAIGYSVLPWLLQVANKGWKRAVIDCFTLQQGLCLVDNHVTNQSLATNTQLPFTPVEQVLENEIQHFTSQQQQQQQNQQNLLNLKQQLSCFRTQQGVYSGFTIEA